MYDINDLSIGYIEKYNNKGDFKGDYVSIMYYLGADNYRDIFNDELYSDSNPYRIISYYEPISNYAEKDFISSIEAANILKKAEVPIKQRGMSKTFRKIK